ncbi:hypothetical protein ALC56_00367 [Trachymyrmex septentrionalis]|uniref:Uncharacterized protein n=1 Tax=Trachymyrmex septentrionalis TaxID=34720 RepID=A0A195FXT2_9HYME|nr:hypothetical protein ALC56_00367 [Trachymyrmex septentrionalis]
MELSSVLGSIKFNQIESIGGATSTRRRTFHGPQRITRNLDENLASCDELEGSDATIRLVSLFSFREFIVKKMPIFWFCKKNDVIGTTDKSTWLEKQFSVGDRSMARQTAVTGICSQCIPEENDRGKARRNHEISFNRADV